MCVDAFSKWVVLDPLPNRKSKTLAEWFELEILYKRGLPLLVRTDNGSEWAKDFVKLCKEYHIRMRKIKPRHSRSNGLAERMVKTVKVYLDKFLRNYPSLEFDRVVGKIAMVVNALPSAATGLSPYFIENGKEFRLPILRRLMK